MNIKSLTGYSTLPAPFVIIGVFDEKVLKIRIEAFAGAGVVVTCGDVVVIVGH